MTRSRLDNRRTSERETIPCPCCGEPMKAAHLPAIALMTAPLTPMERKIVDMLSDIYPRSCGINVLADRVYADHFDGGPLNANNTLSVTLMRLRPKLIPLGWRIPNAKSGRGVKGNYRLERIERAAE